MAGQQPTLATPRLQAQTTFRSHHFSTFSTEIPICPNSSWVCSPNCSAGDCPSEPDLDAYRRQPIAFQHQLAMAKLRTFQDLCRLQHRLNADIEWAGQKPPRRTALGGEDGGQVNHNRVRLRPLSKLLGGQVRTSCAPHSRTQNLVSSAATTR